MLVLLRARFQFGRWLDTGIANALFGENGQMVPFDQLRESRPVSGKFLRGGRDSAVAVFGGWPVGTGKQELERAILRTVRC